MKEAIEKILSPAIDVQAPYAKMMIQAILDVFEKETPKVGTQIDVAVNRENKTIVAYSGDLTIVLDPPETRKFAELLVKAADLVDSGQIPIH